MTDAIYYISNWSLWHWRPCRANLKLITDTGRRKWHWTQQGTVLQWRHIHRDFGSSFVFFMCQTGAVMNSLRFWATGVKQCAWSLLSLKHPVGRLFGVDQCDAVRRVQRVSGVHSEKPEQSRVPRHGRSVWLHHQLHSDVSGSVSLISIYLSTIYHFLNHAICCVCWKRSVLEHKEVAAIQWSWQVGE